MNLKGEVVVNLIVTGRHMKLTQEIKSYIDCKLNKLEKYLSSEFEVKVTLSAKSSVKKVEVTIIPINGPIIRAEEVQDDLYVAIDIVYDKLCIQIEKYKSRKKEKFQSNKTIRINNKYMLNDEVDYFDEDESIIERRKKFNIKPMSLEEAVLQMDLLGHKFYMFRNQYTDEINVIYKRDNGGYGLIEHE